MNQRRTRGLFHTSCLRRQQRAKQRGQTPETRNARRGRRQHGQWASAQVDEVQSAPGGWLDASAQGRTDVQTANVCSRDDKHVYRRVQARRMKPISLIIGAVQGCIKHGRPKTSDPRRTATDLIAYRIASHRMTRGSLNWSLAGTCPLKGSPPGMATAVQAHAPPHDLDSANDQHANLQPEVHFRVPCS